MLPETVQILSPIPSLPGVLTLMGLFFMASALGLLRKGPATALIGALRETTGLAWLFGALSLLIGGSLVFYAISVAQRSEVAMLPLLVLGLVGAVWSLRGIALLIAPGLPKVLPERMPTVLRAAQPLALVSGLICLVYALLPGAL